MENKLENRRNLTRRHLIFYLDVVDAKTDTVLGQLADITSEGIMIVSKKPLQINKVFNIKIVLPNIKGFTKKFINADIITRWESPDINTDLNCTGCQFSKIKSEDKLTVVYLIKVLGFDN